MTDRRGGGGSSGDEAFLVDLAGGKALAAGPDHCARTHPLAFMPAIQHRPARQHDGWQIHGRGGHDAAGRGLVAAGGEHDAIERIAVQYFNQPEIGEVAIERGSRPPAVFKDRVERELHGDAAGIPDAFLHPLRQLQMHPVARIEIAARLGDADDRPAGPQFGRREAIVHEAFQIDRHHVRPVGIGEPVLRAQAPPAAVLAIPVAGRAAVCHLLSPATAILSARYVALLRRKTVYRRQFYPVKPDRPWPRIIA